VPTPAGQGGVPDPAGLDAAARAAADAGRPIRSVILTLPDNPTGTLAAPETIRAVCQVAEEHDLIIIADEIYRDLVHDPAAALLSPAEVAPLRTVVTTALSKSLAVGGWRSGVAACPRCRTSRWVRPCATGCSAWQRDLVRSRGTHPAGGGLCLR
jgi:aspartate aminotransferase